MCETIPVADARHELDAAQGGKPTDWRTLPVGVRMLGIRLDLGLIEQEASKKGDSFPDPTRDEMTE